MRKGQSFVSLVIMIGAIMAIVGALVAFFALSYIGTTFGTYASARADAAANSGIQDAMLHLDRDPSWAPSPYTLTVGSSTATVTVTQSSTAPEYVTVLSSATVSSYTRKIQAVLLVNPSTTQLSVVSWQYVQ